jgi:hypothetical protein
MKRRTKPSPVQVTNQRGIVDRLGKQFKTGMQMDKVTMGSEEFLLFTRIEPLMPRTYPMKKWRKDARAMNVEAARRSPRPS